MKKISSYNIEKCVVENIKDNIDFSIRWKFLEPHITLKINHNVVRNIGDIASVINYTLMIDLNDLKLMPTSIKFNVLQYLKENVL